MNLQAHTTLTVSADCRHATGELKYVFRGDGVPWGKVVNILPHSRSDRVKILMIEKARVVGGPPIVRPFTGSLPVKFPWDE